MEISRADRETLRALASEYMEYASLPAQNEKIGLWKALNRLEMKRPMVVIDQLPWNELNAGHELDCKVENAFFRGVESSLRQSIFKWRHFPVDMVLNPYVLIPRPVANTGFGITVDRDVSVTDGTNSVVGQYYHDQLNDWDDLEKLKTPKVSLDRELEAEIFGAANDIFDGIAPVRAEGCVMHLGIWDWLAQWMGVEDCYLNLIDRPDFLHAIMRRLTDGVLSEIGQMNALGVFDVNSHVAHCSYTFDDRLPSGSCDRANPTSRDAWGFGMAQLFTSVSPEVTDEFEVRYMREIFENFGAVYYGCCDRLDDRLELIDTLPNIRKISCSPWSDRERFAEKLPKKYVMSNKPSPAFLAEADFCEAEVRADLRRTIDAAKRYGVNLELILKDVSTVKYDPTRLERWAKIAMEEAEG